MPKQIQNRDEPRYPVPSAMGAELEFDRPDGTRHRYSLLDVSMRGACFAMPLRSEGIDAGAMLVNALLLVDDVKIGGNLAVQHTTRQFRANYTCGVQFFPRTDLDQNQLVSLVSRMDSQRSAPGHPCRDAALPE
jgi:hypothetical protein